MQGGFFCWVFMRVFLGFYGFFQNQFFRVFMGFLTFWFLVGYS